MGKFNLEINEKIAVVMMTLLGLGFIIGIALGMHCFLK